MVEVQDIEVNGFKNLYHHGTLILTMRQKDGGVVPIDSEL